MYLRIYEKASNMLRFLGQVNITACTAQSVLTMFRNKAAVRSRDTTQVNAFKISPAYTFAFSLCFQKSTVARERVYWQFFFLHFF